MNTTTDQHSEIVTGTVTHSRTLWAPVVLLGAAHGQLLVETLAGGVGGWARKGKRLTVSPKMFEQD